jgi:steroid delta-isomerase-like uncharacterized protein
MSPEENKILFRRYIEEVWNKGNPYAVKEFVAPDYVFHTEAPGPGNDAEILCLVVVVMREAFPDAVWTIDDLVAEDDRVAGRVTLRGTHQGEYMGLAPTGKPVTIQESHFVRFAQGKIVERWQVVDNLSFMTQLGLATLRPSRRSSKRLFVAWRAGDEATFNAVKNSLRLQPDSSVPPPPSARVTCPARCGALRAWRSRPAGVSVGRRAITAAGSARVGTS